MNRLMMSCAAAGLLRELIARSGASRDRFLLTEYRSVDWQSLTFIGERHEFQFRLAGPGADRAFECLTSGLEEAEFEIPRQIVADVSLSGPPERAPDGTISFGIEALTIAE